MQNLFFGRSLAFSGSAPIEHTMVGEARCEHADKPAPLDPQRARLLARIRQRYTTSSLEVQIGGTLFHLLRVANQDEVWREMEAAGQVVGRGDAFDQPYWAEAWESGVGLGQVLARRKLAGMKVLDLGCGLGLTGAVAAAGGADVLLADASSPALLFARLNTWPWRGRARLRRLDWRQQRLSERFQLIVGSDVLYDATDWPYLEAFWREHLAGGGTVLLGEPGRKTGDAFPTWLAPRGWQITQAAVPVTGRKQPIRLLEIALSTL